METWIAGLHELAMPSDETTYWCSVHESFPLDTPKYVIGVSSIAPQLVCDDFLNLILFIL